MCNIFALKAEKITRNNDISLSKKKKEREREKDYTNGTLVSRGMCISCVCMCVLYETIIFCTF